MCLCIFHLQVMLVMSTHCIYYRSLPLPLYYLILLGNHALRHILITLPDMKHSSHFISINKKRNFASFDIFMFFLWNYLSNLYFIVLFLAFKKLLVYKLTIKKVNKSILPWINLPRDLFVISDANIQGDWYWEYHAKLMRKIHTIFNRESRRDRSR